MNRQQRRAAAKQGQRDPGASRPTVPPGVGELFAAGVAHHQAGRLPQAEACYRQVLAAQPDHADALHLLGVIAYQVGRYDVAADLIRQAIARNGNNPAFFTNLGNALRDQGRLEESVAACRDAIRVDPNFAEAYCNLGTAFCLQGKLDEAVAAYRQAIRIHPGFADAHFNLGNVLRVQGKLDEAVAACRQAVRIDPGSAKAHSNLGAALSNQGKLEEAIAACREAIRIKPNLAEAYSILGTALRESGKFDDATAACRQAIRIKPDEAGAHCNLGSVLRDQGKLDDAVTAFREALRVKPDSAELYFNLGLGLKDQGKLDEALAAYRQALHIKPDYAEAQCNLGVVLGDQGKLEEAVSACRQAIRIKPNLAEAYSALGVVLRQQGKLDDSINACRQAIRIEPNHARAHCYLGNTLYDQGNHDEAIAAYHQAIVMKPDFPASTSNLLMCLNYDEHVSASTLFDAHRDWEQRHGRPVPWPHAYANDRSVGQRLKVGYVSPDFRQHSVAYFLEPLMRSHDRKEIEVFCYAEVSAPDAVTGWFKQLADHWVATVGISDEALAERIRHDGIDILVDLAGHTAKNRLPVFARKPAPVQVTWLGYPNTTGLKAIDYRLVDAVTDPAGEADALAIETLVRLPGGFLCYGAPDDAPVPAPTLTTGTVTFGSFNSPAKLSAATLDAWAQVLARLPKARLLLKGKPFADAATRALYLDRLAERGVAPERVELAVWLPDQAHLALYDRVDIALDPFPYNGTTTTCEALWMGVPVVTLRGDRHAGRVGASLLTQMGMTELIAHSVEEYVETAVALARDPARLAHLRHSLRPRMAASPLCDAAGFARKVENAYRSMWQRWGAASTV
jgi:predicted O-linked N-acetylglucosamine transferase (SPINDLY family)